MIVIKFYVMVSETCLIFPTFPSEGFEGLFSCVKSWNLFVSTLRFIGNTDGFVVVEAKTEGCELEVESLELLHHRRL